MNTNHGIKLKARFRLALALATTALFLTGCSTDGGSTTIRNSGGSSYMAPSDQSQAPSETLITVTGPAGKAPELGKPTGTPPTTLVKQDVIVGNGAQVLPTSTVTVHYTLMAWSTGEVVETSWAATPATFPLNGVIVGWQEGMPGMKIGGRRLLVIPPELGYGATGSGPIKPNETLIFVIDLLSIEK